MLKILDDKLKERVKISGFVLIIVGTVCLLLNEFIFGWGRTATLTLAALNVIGLASLAFAHWGMRDKTD